VSGIDARALAESLRRLQEPDDQVPLIDSLKQVVNACVALFGVDGSGLMLADEQSLLRYAVSSDGSAKLLEDAQLEVNAGPCVTTFVENQPIATPDVVSDARWPALSARMSGTGVAAVFGVPIRLGAICVGSLDLYRSIAHEWDDSEQRALQRYGDVAGTMLVTALRAHRAGELAEQLSYALEYRVAIERGIGYLMARDGLNSVEAFGRLRTAARNSRRKIGDIATDLVTTGALPGERRSGGGSAERTTDTMGA
jgi:transcriptional regulator with GAF, ATPase, and Fis domain